MRIIAGALRSRTIPTAGLVGARPTTDRVRESIFNILERYEVFADGHALDLFAGSGALGFEALSRGAEHCTFIERNRKNAERIRATADQFGLASRTTVIQGDALRSLRALDSAGKFSVIFSDPPYRRGLAQDTLTAVAAADVLDAQGALVIERYRYESAPHAALRLVEKRVYGDTIVEFFQQPHSQADP